MNYELRIKKSRKRGFTLVETLVAISIFTLSILGLMSILTSGVADTSYAKQKITASYLAQEGIEHARNIRDTHVLYEGNSGWAHFKTDPKVTDYDSPSEYSNFHRTVTLTKINDEESMVSSRVSWTQGSGNYSITFSEELFDWVE
jgi:prepilin-type N-terminal cleavage/methylation domain-containing protein